MNFILKRIFLGDTYTIGNLYVDGKYLCDTIEDATRDKNKDGKLEGTEKKVYGKTSIPYGTYEVIVNKSPKFKRDLPLLLNVPHFEGIRIHRGNTAEDSEGCILPGKNKVKGKVLNSSKYEELIIGLMKKAIKNNEKITIKIE